MEEKYAAKPTVKNPNSYEDGGPGTQLYTVQRACLYIVQLALSIALCKKTVEPIQVTRVVEFEFYLP